MSSRRDTEDNVELLECSLLGLRYHKEDDQEGQHVEAGIKTERAGRRDLGQQRGKCETESTAHCVVDANRESSTDLAVGEWERFGEVDRRDGTNA